MRLALAIGASMVVAMAVPGTAVSGVPPQPIPKPRGIHGARSPTRTNRTPDDNVINPDAYGGSEPQPPPWRMRVSGSRPVHWPA